MLLRRASIRYYQILQRPLLSKIPWLSSVLQYSDLATKKGKAAPLQERQMRDRVKVWAKGGEGGNGCWSYRRSRTDQYGKADGANGGRGGDVILECSSAIWDFSNLQHHLNAKRGGQGESKNKIGRRGSDKVVQVPIGTVIHLVTGGIPSFVNNTSTRFLQPWDMPDSEEAESAKSLHADSSVRILNISAKEDTDNFPSPRFKHHEGLHIQKINSEEYSEDKYGTELVDDDNEENENEEEDEEEEEEEEEEEIAQFSVAELTKPGQRLLVARGGEGGLGNLALKNEAKINILRKTIEHKNGLEEFEDNEGNRPSLTTGRPGSESILILELKSIADVGLVGMPNAGKSTLLGAVSRAKPTVGHYAFTTLRPNIGNLSYDDFFSMTVADIPGLIKGAHANRGLGHAFLRHIERTKVLAYVVDLKGAIPPWEQLRDLVVELEYHQEGLSRRPSLVVANKIDEEGAQSAYEELKRRVKGVPVFPVCAVLEEGVAELKDGLRRLMDGSELPVLELDSIMLD